MRYLGATPLLWAAYSNPNSEVIATLLKAGADIKAQDRAGGKNALIWAVKGGNPNLDAITMLLKAGADAKVKDKAGYTAYEYAKYNEKLKGTDALEQLREATQ